MKALVYRNYGSAENLKVEDVAEPVPKADQVLVEVQAVALNASDVEFLHGSPIYVRMWGLRRPGYPILGSDIAGRVLAVGESVTRFSPGDEVFGDAFDFWGGLGQRVCAPESRLLRKPAELSFAQAAAIPQSGVLAWQCLRACPNLASAQIAINGAGGGAGTFAVQIAAHFGARAITAVDRGDKLARLQELGAQRVIDYRQRSFAEDSDFYDHIVDFVATQPLGVCARSLRSQGTYQLVGGSLLRLVSAGLSGAIVSKLTGKKLGVFVHRQSLEDLQQVADLCVQGKVIPVIDRCYALAESAEAFAHLAAGHIVGKAIVNPQAR
jgi:NADPH:quinone reductase-like Zn-dependent oxidoreductase